tara:strand:+ start:650 stop:781 length:132 start_codon:yes stop_codon:yes gene_type:complete
VDNPIQWRKERLRKVIKQLGYANYDDGIRPKVVIMESCGFISE